jgi:glycogen synthase
MPQPLRIALVAIEYPPDPYSAGIGAYTKALATGLVARGHRIHVITRGAAESISDEAGVTVHRLIPARPELPERLRGVALAQFIASIAGREWRYRQNIAVRLRSLVTQGEVSLIEAADHMAEAIFYRPSQYSQVPFIVRLHTPLAYSERIDPHVPELLRQLVAQIEGLFVRRASHITAPGRVCAAVFRETLSLGNRPIAVFPNPPTVAPLPAAPQQANSEPMVLFVGRLTRWKGVHVLAQAIESVHAQLPETRFVFVGADHTSIDGFTSVTSYLKSLIPPESLERVTFTGYVQQTELAQYYEQAAVCAFPSLFEAFGYTCLEAMSFGKAIVGSNQGGMVEMLERGAGLLYTPPDADELVRHILTLLNDPSLRQSLGETARRRVQTTFALDTVLDTTEAFYRQALASSQSKLPYGDKQKRHHKTA